jgi:hypothetical protein
MRGESTYCLLYLRRSEIADTASYSEAYSRNGTGIPGPLGLSLHCPIDDMFDCTDVESHVGDPRSSCFSFRTAISGTRRDYGWKNVYDLTAGALQASRECQHILNVLGPDRPSMPTRFVSVDTLSNAMA